MNIGSAAAQLARKPFPFVELPEFLNRKDADRVLDWLEATSVWQFRAESFYEQYEFNLLSSPPVRLTELSGRASLCWGNDEHASTLLRRRGTVRAYQHLSA